MNVTLSSATPEASASLHVLKQEQEKEGLYFQHKVDWSIAPLGVGKVTAAKIMIQGSLDDASVSSGVSPNIGGDGAIISPALAVGSTATNIANGLFYYLINGANASKAANAIGTAFSAVHKVAASKFGAITVWINAAGSITTKINSSAQTDTLSFDTAALALANAASTTPPTDTIKIGTVLIENDGVLWNANTQNLTPGGDVTTSTFFNETSSFTEIDEYELNADDIIAQKGVFYIDAALPDKYIRLFLSEVTGNGTFSITDTLLPFRRTHVQDGIA
jgi:hypothetical protein